MEVPAVDSSNSSMNCRAIRCCANLRNRILEISPKELIMSPFRRWENESSHCEDNVCYAFSNFLESRMLEEGMKKPPWRPLHLLGVSTCFIGSHMFTHFPHNLHKYTAAYWIPYYVGLLLIVIPCLYVQLRLGATTQSNVVALFSKCCPILKGVGFTNVIQLIIFSIYNNVLVAYSLYYAYTSLSQPYRWSTCTEEWARSSCQNETFLLDSSTPEYQYFERQTLQLTRDITEVGTVPWHLIVCLVVSWAWVFLLIFPGMYYMGRTMTILGASALIMLVALMAYGREELDHSHPEKDVYSMLSEKLVEPDFKEALLGIWLQGLFDGVLLSQVWEGVFPTIGKYAGPSRLVSHLSWVFLISVLVVMPHACLHFMIPFLGGLSEIANLPVGEVMIKDIHLLYIVFPAAFRFLNIKRGVAFVFFFIIFIFSSQTQALFVSVAIDNIIDALRTKVLRCCTRKWVLFTAIAAIYCIVGFGLGVPHITEGGFYLLVLVRSWTNKLICFLIFFSFIAFAVSYAKQQHYPVANRIVFLIWFTTGSLIATAVTTYQAAFHDEPKKFSANITITDDYGYPQWAYILGWFIAGGPLLLGLLLGSIHAVVSAAGDSCHKKLFSACFPDHDRKRHDRPEVGSYADTQHADSALRY